jgi:hypothetical protein
MQQKISEDVTIYLAGAAPRVLGISPEPGTSEIPTSAVISAVFDVELDPATLTGSTVTLTRLSPATAVPGTLSYDAATRTASFTPATRLDPDKSYRLTVTTGVKSAKGAALGTSFSTTFTTRYFHDDEIGIDLTYSSSDLVLNANAPIYIQLYTIPLPFPPTIEDMTILDSLPITASGKYRIPRALIPRQSSQALVFLFHDIDNNYVPGGDGAGAGDSERIIQTGVPGNATDPDDGTIILENADGFFLIDPSLILETGTGYTVTYSDGTPYEADGFEVLDIPPSNSRLLSQGIFESARNLHSLNDVDYLRFTPPTTDHYVVEVKDTDYQLRVELHGSDSSALLGGGGLAGSTGSTARIINESAYQLTGGQTYYLRVNSPNSGMGPYEIGFRLRDVPEDQYEPDNYSPASPTTLLPGRQNMLSATLSDGPGSQDVDVYAITVEAGQRYAIEVTESDNHFGSYLDNRNVQFKITMYTSWDGSIGAGIWQSDLEGFYQTANGRVMFDASRVNVTSGSETRWIVVSNQSPQQGGTGPRPSAAYSILYTWGPDVWDKEYVESQGGPRSDDTINGTTAIGADIYLPGEAKVQRTIYSGTNTANPGSDVDWFRFTARSATLEYIVSAQPAAGVDGIAGDLTLYRSTSVGGNAVPATTGETAVKGQSQPWTNTADGTVGFIFQPWTALGYSDTAWSEQNNRVFWIKVQRSTEVPGNPVAGRYTLSIKGGADDEDSYYISDTKQSDIQVDLGGGGMAGIDETPWIGPPFSMDFSNRNQLAWAGDYGGRYTRQALGENLDQYHWSIYRRDYDYNGEPDGVNNPSVDWDFTWVEIPAGGLNGSNFYIQLISDSNPAMPLKLSYWKVSSTAWTSYKSDGVVRQAELGTPTGVYTTHPDDVESLYAPINGVVAGEIYVFRIERNGTSSDGHPVGGVYWFRLVE